MKSKGCDASGQGGSGPGSDQGGTMTNNKSARAAPSKLTKKGPARAGPFAWVLERALRATWSVRRESIPTGPPQTVDRTLPRSNKIIQSCDDTFARRHIGRHKVGTDFIEHRPQQGGRFVIRHRRAPASSRCATALAASDVRMLRPYACRICFHQMIELRPLARDQELGRGIVEALALQLPDGRAQFEDFGAKFQNPVGVAGLRPPRASNISAARDHACRATRLLRGTKAHPVADVRQDIAAPGRLPFADQQIDFPAQIHLRLGLFGAVAIAIDEIAHGHLDSGHLQPQGADFTSNFINSVVHDLLEQNKNI